MLVALDLLPGCPARLDHQDGRLRHGHDFGETGRSRSGTVQQDRVEGATQAGEPIADSRHAFFGEWKNSTEASAAPDQVQTFGPLVRQTAGRGRKLARERQACDMDDDDAVAGSRQFRGDSPASFAARESRPAPSTANTEWLWNTRRMRSQCIRLRGAPDASPPRPVRESRFLEDQSVSTHERLLFSNGTIKFGPGRTRRQRAR